jgi:hypothetical protein
MLQHQWIRGFPCGQFRSLQKWVEFLFVEIVGEDLVSVFIQSIQNSLVNGMIEAFSVRMGKYD